MTHQEISADFPFESRYVEVHGSKIHYVEEGSGMHYLMEDNPHLIGEEIAAWYKTL